MAVTVVLVVAFLLWRRNRKYSFGNKERAIDNPTYSGDLDTLRLLLIASKICSGTSDLVGILILATLTEPVVVLLATKK